MTIVIQMSEGLIKWSEAEAEPELRQANKESGCGPALLSSSTDFCRSQGFANRASLAPGYCQFNAIKAARHRSLLLLVCIARKNRSTHCIACFVILYLGSGLFSSPAYNKNAIHMPTEHSKKNIPPILVYKWQIDKCLVWNILTSQCWVDMPLWHMEGKFENWGISTFLFQKWDRKSGWNPRIALTISESFNTLKFFAVKKY